MTQTLLRPFGALRLRRFLRMALPVLAFAAGGGAQALDLTVTVQGARSSAGSIRAALFAEEGAWLKDDRALQAQSVAVAAGGGVLVFRGLPAGRYAMSVFHDENGNAKLDTNIVGIPSEPYGFSRDAGGRFGPPRFAEAALDLQQDSAVTVRLN